MSNGNNNNMCYNPKAQKKQMKIQGPWSFMSSIESIYEINIQEQNSFTSKASTCCSEQEKLATANVYPVTLEKEGTNGNTFPGNGLKIIANPFIESYYPVLNKETNEKVDDDTDTSFITLKDDYFTEIDYSCSSKNKLTEFKERFGRNESSLRLIREENEKSGMPAEKFKKHCERSSEQFHGGRNLKRQIIETYSSLFQKENKVKCLIKKDAVDRDQLHLHHHEHHHYHYLSDLASESDNHRYIIIPKGETLPKGSKTSKALPREQDEAFSKDERLSNSAFGKPRPTENFNCRRLVAEEVKPSNTRARTFVDSSVVSYNKLYSSTDSLILNKTSDLITTHTFSDSNVGLASENQSQPLTYFVVNPKESDGKTLVDENGKNVECLTRFDLTYDRKTESKKKVSHSKSGSKVLEKSQVQLDNLLKLQSSASEIVKFLEDTKCCAKTGLGTGKLKTDANDSNLIPIDFDKLIEKELNLPTKSSALKSGCLRSKPKITKINLRDTGVDILLPPKSESPAFHTFGQKGQLPGTSHCIAEENNLTPGRQNVGLWTGKLKKELVEIKNQLHRIEERHCKKKKCQEMSHCLPGGNPQGANDFLGPEITVYSSKTFILEANNHSADKNQKCSQVGKKNAESWLASQTLSSSEGDTCELH